MNLLLTGGTGYIGSHSAVVLTQAGHRVVLLDNLSNSNCEVVERIARIVGEKLPFVQGDVRDTDLVRKIIRNHSVDAVIHFAGLKAVGESVEKPIDYYANNLQGTISLLQAMQAESINTLVFSSSATVYGQPRQLPLDESHPTDPENPYGRTKLQIEEMLRDVAASDSDWRIACLRYFNPVGAHDSGLIGEQPEGVPNNLMPFIAQVAAGQRPELRIFGNDYPTVDGTGVRDYIHVMDLAEGHLAALDFLGAHTGWHEINLGVGRGFSVMQVLQSFEEICGRPIPYKIVARRPGDIAECYANTDKAHRLMGWKTRRTMQEMCSSAWRFQQKIREKVRNSCTNLAEE